jgi:hypothetical protein
MSDHATRANPAQLARLHAARLAGALAGHQARPAQKQLADRMERLIDALTREGVPMDRAIQLASQSAPLSVN